MSIRTELYFKPETDVHVTKMVICDWSLVIVYLFVCCKLVEHTPGVSDKIFVIQHITDRRQNLVTDKIGTRSAWQASQKSETEIWHRFMEPVSGACRELKKLSVVLSQRVSLNVCININSTKVQTQVKYNHVQMKINVLQIN